MTGTLILVVGPSGAGKDTLLEGAQAAFSGDPRIVFPRRVITRPADAGGENHVAATLDEFERSERDGAFALSWLAHGLAYGVPGVVCQDLRDGRHVVVNVSRSVIAEARDRFTSVTVIRIDAPPEVLARRLAQRGREDPEAVQRRLDRMVEAGDDPWVHVVMNDRTAEEGIARFTAVIREIAGVG